MNRERNPYEKRNSMKLASLTVLLAGTTLFTPGFTVKAESTQSISNSSKVHDQKESEWMETSNAGNNTNWGAGGIS